MTTDSPNIESILCQAIKLASSAERQAYLDRVCGHDAQLRGRLEKLIADHFNAGDFYAETCASLATCFWNYRLFLLHGDGKYIDALERALYNGVLSGVALDGKTFYYPNPLASSGGYSRSKWFACACCPSNVCRFIPSVPGYVYAVRDDTLYVNLFVAGSAEVELAGGTMRIEQQTTYPWDGSVSIKVLPAEPGQQSAMKVRIPGWARGEASSTDLYHFLDDAEAEWHVAVNGEPVTAETHRGYVAIDRTWQPGDSVTLELPMPVRRVVAHENVEANRGRVALTRGPIVYCVEWPDVPGGQVNNLVLPDDMPLASEFRKNLLGGVPVVTGVVQRTRQAPEAQREGGTKLLPITEEMEFTAIPYYAWAHRGPGPMAVWLARTPDVVE